MSDVISQLDGHVQIITINRARKMNSLDFAANDSLIEALEAFADNDEARVAVLTGAGDQAFCAGADLKTYTMAFAKHSAPEFRRKFTDGYGLGGITRGLKINKPIIGAVNGYAISGGFEIALACDLRLCSPNARFGLQDVNWGFHACDGALVRLKEIVGLGNAMEFVLTGDLFDAQHAARIGLVNRVVEDQPVLDAAIQWAHTLASKAPLAQQLAKDTMYRVHGLTMDEALKLESMSFHNLAFSEDLAEGTAAFAEKRSARFKGR